MPRSGGSRPATWMPYARHAGVRLSPMPTRSSIFYPASRRRGRSPATSANPTKLDAPCAATMTRCCRAAARATSTNLRRSTTTSLHRQMQQYRLGAPPRVCVRTFKRTVELQLVPPGEPANAGLAGAEAWSGHWKRMHRATALDSWQESRRSSRVEMKEASHQGDHRRLGRRAPKASIGAQPNVAPSRKHANVTTGKA